MKVGYYDIEAAHWDGFVVGATLAPDATAPEFHWHRAESMLEAMAEHPGTEWRGHYAGRYDALLLLTLACEAGWRVKVTTRGASILRARLRRPGDRKTTITLYDTHALAPVSLAKLTKAAGKTQKGSFDFELLHEGLQPGSPTGRLLSEYLAHDVLSLRDGDTAWRDVVRSVAGVEPASTLGGTAWKSAALRLASCGEDVSEPMRRFDYDDGRAGYFGGRVEVFRTSASAVWRYDRNSSYPAALTRQPVPVGRRRWQKTWNGEEGTVWCRVKVHESHHPALPVRLRDRLVYPHGTFSGAWTAVELRHALENGAELLSVDRARVAEKTTDALAGWCREVWEARVARPEWAGLIKLLANSLTGKLAQRPERSDTAYTALDEVPAGAELLTKPKDGRVWWRVTSDRLSPCARPEWAAYLTAEARTELHLQLSAVGDGAAYCDTDSVYSVSTLSRNLGAGLGEWKLEGIGDDWQCRAPKLYRYAVDGQVTVKARGQRGLTAEGFERLCSDGTPWETSAGVESLMTALSRRGEASFTRATVRRGLARADDWCGGRLRTAGPETRAPSYPAALERWGAPKE